MVSVEKEIMDATPSSRRHVKTTLLFRITVARTGTQHQDFFADVNVTLRVALERSVVESAAPVPAEFVQLFADVNVTLRIALERSVVDPLA